MKRLNLILAAVFGAVVAWLAVRSRGPATPPGGPAASPVAVGQADSGPESRDRFVDPESLRRATAHPGDRSEPVVEERVSAAPLIEAGLGETRTRLFEALKAKKDPKLAELVQLLAEFRLNTPEIAASAWVLSDNWGVYASGEAEARKRIEDPVMFEKLAKTRREILLDVPEEEFKQVVGGTVDPAVMKGIEDIGRKYPPEEKARRRRP